MGWTHCYSAKHWVMKKGRTIVDRKACVDDLYTWTQKDEHGNATCTTRVLKSAMRGSTWYGACETVLADGTRRVWAGVCLTCGRTRHDDTIWGYRDMDESFGPYNYDCPAALLDLLTETTCENSNAWRSECRKRASDKKMSKTVALPPGVSATYRGGWTISSPEYRAKNYYCGVHYSRMGKIEAVGKFVADHGTPEQKAAWAKASAA